MPFVQNFPFFSIFIPILCAVVCLLLPGRVAQQVTIVCFVTVSVLSAALLAFTIAEGASFIYMMGNFPSPFGNEIRSGVLEAFMALLFSIVSFLSVLGGLSDAKKDIPKEKITLFFLMQNLVLGAMLAIIYTNDIFTGYVFVDIITIAACSLVSFKPGGRTLAATAVYLIMSLIGSGLVLLSIAMLYGVTGHLLMPGLQAGVLALSNAGDYTMPLFVLIALMTCGLAIKSALFPFHSWLPDAHANATTTSSAVLSGLVIKCSLIFLLKLNYRVFGLSVLWQLRLPHLLLAFGTAGIIAGSWMAMRQRNIKRMLSYSSIAQVGYISVAMSLNIDAGIAAACFHIAVHAVGKAMLFSAAGGLSAVSETKMDYDALRGAAHRDPISGAAFVLGGISMVGIPPFAGFASKFYLATAAVDTPFVIPVFIAVIVAGSVLSAMYYFPVIACILSKNEDRVEPVKMHGSNCKTRGAALCMFMCITLLFSFFSQRVLQIILAGLAVFG